MQHPHLDTPVSSLRQRLIDDMNMRRFSRETQRNYLRDIGRLAAFLGRSPDTATADDLRRFQIEQQEDGVPVPTMNSIVSALRFFFTHTLDRPDLARRLVRLAHPRNLPVVLSRDEVARLLNATTCLKHQAALSVAYGAGLRVAEVSMLKVADVDSERMLLHEHPQVGDERREVRMVLHRQHLRSDVVDRQPSGILDAHVVGRAGEPCFDCVQDPPERKHVGTGRGVLGNADAVRREQLLETVDKIGCARDLNLHALFPRPPVPPALSQSRAPRAHPADGRLDQCRHVPTAIVIGEDLSGRCATGGDYQTHAA